MLRLSTPEFLTRHPRLGFVIVFLVVSFSALAEPVPEESKEFSLRGGLPTTTAVAQRTNGELRVAYLGGSITAAGGWRSLTTEHLKQLFPQLTVHEINAALPGTGSDLGVCRLRHDVLRHRPDLLVVEFAVNDSSTPPDQVERSIEGIVRQTRGAASNTDILIVHTVSTPGLAAYQNGTLPPASGAMERVAEHYGIPSLHFGFEVVRRVSSGVLIFKGSAAGQGASVFSLDGVHPTETGHRLYFEQMRKYLPSLLQSEKSAASLPAPLHADNWERAGMQLMSEGRKRGEWTRVERDDPNLRGATKSLLPETWRATQPGDAVEFEFTGTRFGLLGIAAPDNGEFSVTVDGLAPVSGTFFDAYVSPTFCRQRDWKYPTALGPGKHRVRVQLLSSELDKATIKSERKGAIEDPALYREHTLTLCALLWVDETAH